MMKDNVQKHFLRWVWPAYRIPGQIWQSIYLQVKGISRKNEKQYSLQVRILEHLKRPNKSCVNWKYTELETILLETHNPDRLLSISTVDTFKFYAKSAWFLNLRYQEFLCFLISLTENSLASDWIYVHFSRNIK